MLIQVKEPNDTDMMLKKSVCFHCIFTKKYKSSNPVQNFQMNLNKYNITSSSVLYPIPGWQWLKSHQIFIINGTIHLTHPLIFPDFPWCIFIFYWANNVQTAEPISSQKKKHPEKYNHIRIYWTNNFKFIRICHFIYLD